jgi:GxxExxY protein
MNHEDHEEIEGLEDDPLFKKSGMRLPSPRSSEAEVAMQETIGAAIAVHRALGPGFLESIYRKAMCLELDSRNVAYEVERPVRVTYRDIEIPGQRVDLIVEGLIVVELTSVVRSALRILRALRG